MNQFRVACPACTRPGGALTAEPHCRNKACTWNKCMCGATYSRETGAGYTVTNGITTHFPAREAS